MTPPGAVGTMAIPAYAPPRRREHAAMDSADRAAAVERRLREQFIQSLGGDPAAYRGFLQALAAHLRAYFRRRLAHAPDDAEDLVQETLLAVHESRHTYRPAEPFTAWVHSIARYKLVDHLRSRSRREALHDPLDDEALIFSAADAGQDDVRRDLDKLLGQIPEKQRVAIVMMKLEGASASEAAMATGLSPGAVKVGIHRSLKALARKLKGES